ncbi:MAG TPA: L,D-transpeptidase family protein [Bacillota bacterium]|nr:L,D-transpeptidase family protein [Bacillota bacterium]HQD40724.1 L,D-transpeptidase family protein [Bacillota bacterium]
MWKRNWWLSEGSRGPLVFGVQERLQELGYEVPKDGEYAFETKEAVCRWQREAGLPATGVLSPANIEQLWQEAGKRLHIGSAQALPDSDFAGISLWVSLKRQRLYVYSQGKQVKTYPVSCGRAATPTPQGVFRILEMWETDSSLGSRWLSFTPYRHSIHSLPAGQLPGKASTLGCLQMVEADLEELCSYLQVGTPLVVSCREQLPQKTESQWLYYYPQKGEGIEDICHRYHVGISQLLVANNVQRKEELAACPHLLIPTG